MTDLRPPYPWFGGKRTIAATIWTRFGTVRNYIEPFFGSGAVLLGRPGAIAGAETVNDINAWLTNFWRALQADSDTVAHYADWPVSELDLHARGDWLFYRPGVEAFIERIRSDPAYYDAQSAGWWVWGQSCWIGDGWNRELSRAHLWRKRPHLDGHGITGAGIHRMRVPRQVPRLSGASGGPAGAVSRQIPRLSDIGIGVHRPCLTSASEEAVDPSSLRANETGGLRAYLAGLATRLRHVRICCGDWTRVISPAVTIGHGMTAVFLDPPYAVTDRDVCYGDDNDFAVAHAVREWALAHGENPLYRIALCGYDGEHAMPDSWSCYAWQANGGYANSRKHGVNVNNHRERVWFSPHCLPCGGTGQGELFLSEGGPDGYLRISFPGQ
jgi:site-specific DNA-adenine methylase